MSLVNVVFKYLCECPKYASYLFMSIGGLACIELITTVLLAKPEIDNFLGLFCFLYLIDIAWNRNVVFDAKLVVKKKIRTKFILDRWKQYESLSLIDKNRISTYEHREKLNSTADALVLIIDWGLHEFIILLKTIFMLFCISQSYTTLVLMTLSSTSIYYLIFRKAEANFRIIHKNIHKKLLNLRMMLNQRIRMLNFGHTKVTDIEEVMSEHVTLSKKSDRGWNHMAKSIDYINFSNLLILIWMYDSTSHVQTVLLMTVFNKVSRAINWVLRFSHSLQRGEDSYSEYLNLFKDVNYDPLPKQLQMPSIVTIKSIDIHLGQLKISNDQIKSLKIQFGDRILITGPSGAGKTTTLRAIRGLIPGVTIDKHLPSNYINEYIELCDDLHKINFSRASIETLCTPKKNDIFDQNLAFKCLETCCIKYWSDRFTVKESFHGKISSGEKCRVIMALLVLYPLIHFNKRVLILDEPEKSLDPVIAYKVLSNILTLPECKNKIIFVVSHLEKIPECMFNKSIEIKDGQVIF